MNYKEISKSELEDLLAMENKIHEGFIKEKLSLDMSRGKPCSEHWIYPCPCWIF